ncbi:FHA domain-containing protein [Streptomyces sp. NBC_00249]|uniref:FHA domain-containing protein n=1 Tax=Streptomyces sp. NBC_00249 TaxID=2975690 RepID=UPI002250A45B|nr:FHA domain-containing protein [Streptomyces sp. NBC_00249]MCX5199656.1 FHA domain-containing protein [Streptomyces sp. NBC_00249]
MQIRLTVLGSRSGHQAAAAPATCDVLVTAPAGTALAAVASGLAATVGGPDTGGTVVLYAGTRRLDPQRAVLGEPPLIDGAVLALGGPAPDTADDALPDEGPGAAPQLHVVAGPDAGGVHLLHPGAVRIGRSADADVPLDDPDVSRLHCAVTVMPDGRVAVADLGSTNGTTLDGAPVGVRAVPLAPGALLRIGESTLRLAAGGTTQPPLTLIPDLEGHLSLPAPSAPDGPGAAASGSDRGTGAPGSGTFTPGHPDPAHRTPGAPGAGQPGAGGAGSGAPGAGQPGAGRPGSGAPGAAAFGTDHPDLGHPAPGASGPGHLSGGTPGAGSSGPGRTGAGASGTGARGAGHPGAGHHTGHTGTGHPGTGTPGAGYDGVGTDGAGHPGGPGAGHPAAGGTGAGRAPVLGAGRARSGDGAGAQAAAGKRRGLGAWARKWVRGEEEAEAVAVEPEPPAAAAAPDADDPAALLLAALGPTGRLWSRGAGRPGFLEAGLGAGSRVALAESGSLGIAGPRQRLTGVARSVIAQLAGLHAPAQLEIVLLAADRARPVQERRRDWGWLGWLPHVRPAHGQDCRLLLAYDRDQAAARAGELTRRLDDSPLGTNWAAADPAAVRGAAYAYEGPRTLLVLDGDPGAGSLREVTGRLASHGAAAGIHVLVLAEAPSATAASPVPSTYDAACASTPAFRDCATVALLSGDVATAVRTFAAAGGRPVPPGTTAVADAVSAAWAERFARALAPLRTDGAVAEAGYRPATASLPQASRLLDELGLARATPASLMARWAAATDQGQGVGGLAEVVLGTGRRGPVGAELVHDGPHLLVEGPAGSGRTELLRSVAASLSAAARPDRLGLVLLDGAGGERGDGLLPCTELPHVSAHLVASDPLRMREFAQALGAELKRRHELLDGAPFAEWHARRELSDRMVSPRQPAPGELRGDLDPPRSGTLRLRSAAARAEPAAGPSPLPRLVVLVDDFDALVAPGLGSTGRPAAGSVVRALEAVAREGTRLGVHLIATSARPDRTAETELARLATLRVELDAPDQPGPGRGLLRYADGRTVPFQAGRVTGRIPRTATSRPTVVPVEWERMGDPPARRPVRELGNGPTDLALLASALDRASHLVSAVPVLFPPAP